eukprot:CAMPEP_0172488078 /NCGR_PEP_ID=MMETSP1066-20121228/17440_1 /TAXON_ID=671091 /ORGANISM="Coscinodiscus wailesii, Strain CCMP2513" /LENGTH=120 /DNA_ID=CAMNT_0013255069 /DNA_START=452 /DNA_END=812 /DNA_ORIENTATION=+
MKRVRATVQQRQSGSRRRGDLGVHVEQEQGGAEEFSPAHADESAEDANEEREGGEPPYEIVKGFDDDDGCCDGGGFMAKGCCVSGLKRSEVRMSFEFNVSVCVTDVFTAQDEPKLSLDSL